MGVRVILRVLNSDGAGLFPPRMLAMMMEKNSVVINAASI